TWRLQGACRKNDDISAQPHFLPAQNADHAADSFGGRLQPEDLALGQQLCSMKRHRRFQAYPAAIVLAFPVTQIALAAPAAIDKFARHRQAVRMKAFASQKIE